jgi:hypothetical protein
MSCYLASTGLEAPVLVVLALALLFLLVGTVLVLRARRSRGGAAMLLLVALAVGGGVAVGFVPAPPASAAPSDCPTRQHTDEADHDTDAEHDSDDEHDTDADGEQTTEPAEPTETVIEPELENSLTITQTSTMNNLAPGADPKAITGLVVNDGPDDTFITAIAVDIVGVVRANGEPVVGCDASDYVLLDVRMPVGRPLAPYGGSTDFAGASIGFNNKSTNQDACQGATVQLRYLTSD